MMTKNININILWAELFVRQLEAEGIKHVCISPGSRNTPLIFAFHYSSIKKHVIIDERSSGFFALGIAKASGEAVVLLTTSGTAVAELYPAIIEAYQQRIPLIICSADRPATQRNSGANQTINQDNIYKNHIRAFRDMGLPENTQISLENVKETAQWAIRESCFGPIHLNFPFDKPFEPDSLTHYIENDALRDLKIPLVLKAKESSEKPDLSFCIQKINQSKSVLISCGPGNYEDKLIEKMMSYAGMMNIPVLADGASAFRFSSHSNELILINSSAFLKTQMIEPELILHFGSAPTSQNVLEFFKQSKAEKILIHPFGDWQDPSRTASALIEYDYIDFVDTIYESTKRSKKDEGFLQSCLTLEAKTESLKKKYIYNAAFPFEGRIQAEVLENIPSGSNVMLSNSTAVRDVDFFSKRLTNNLKIFTNRGASGIDGISSTALGISACKNETVYLITGDTAFFHDLTALNIAREKDISLTVILINNHGGGIFNMLPVSRYPQLLENYFNVPLNIDFEAIIKAFDGEHYHIQSWEDLKEKIKTDRKESGLRVLEIVTHSGESLQIRQNYWTAVHHEF